MLGHTCPQGTSYYPVSWLRCWQDLLVAQAWTLQGRLALEAPGASPLETHWDTLPGASWLEMVCPVSDDQVALTLS